MKIEIHNYWKNAAPGKAKKQLEEFGHLIVCSIIIDGKLVGEVGWNGKQLAIGDT